MKTSDSASLPDLLPYHSHDPAGVFVMIDGSMGMAWELQPVETDAMDEGGLGALAARVEALLRLLPVGSAAQVIHRISRDTTSTLDRWKASTEARGLLEDLAESRVRTLREVAGRHDGVPIVSRSLRTLFTLRVFPPWPKPFTLNEARAQAMFRSAYSDHRARLLDQAASIESLLQQAGMPASRVTPSDLIAFVRSILNPGRGPDPAADREDLPIARQVALTHAQIGDEVLLGASSFKVLSCSEVPRETWAGMLQRQAAPLDQIVEGVLVLNIEARDPEVIRRSLSAKKRLAFCQMSGGDLKADVAAIKGEVDGVLAGMYSDGDRPFGVRFHVILPGPTAPTINAFTRVGIELVEEDVLAGTLFLQSLPLAYDPANDRALKRGRVMMGANLAHWIPVYGSFRGTAKPDLLLMNRRGEPITFSFFDSDVAPHGIVAGVSGSGKSVFANALVASTRRRGASIFILDRGNSYRKLTSLLGGRYVAFDPSHPRSINPCGRGLDEEKQLFLTDIVAEMCTQGQRELGVRERALVGRAVGQAFATAGDREVLLSDIRAALLAEPETGARDLGICLEPFCGSGPYAGFFDRPSELDYEGGLSVFELGEIAKRRDVGSVILMSLIHNITRYCSSHLAVEKYLIVDEAWTLLRSATTAQFLEDVLRTYRKLNASALMVTQQVGDFEGRTGEAIRANAPNRVFLRQTPETVQAMERLLDLPAPEKALLGSLVTLKGRFAEMLISTPSTKGVARLVPDPLLYWVATSDPKDNALLESLVRKHRDAGSTEPERAAINEAAAAWPHGAGAKGA